MQEYDIIIIGSGLGGLECGAILSKEGFNVCVLEKNPLFGGCFQTYKRDGHLLDTGIHYIGSMDEGKLMNQYFRYLGILDQLKLKRLDEDGFDRIYYGGDSYDYAMGHENFVDTLAARFPDEKNNLKKYVEQLREVGQLIGVKHLRKGIIALPGMKYFSQSAFDQIADCTDNPLLQQILAGTTLLYGGVKDVSTFYHHAMTNNSYLEGAYRFIDGSMQVSDALIKVIKENGGTVLNRKEVTRILTDEEKVTGVEINGEEVIHCKNVISNAHPRLTLQLLDKTRAIKKAYVSRINSLENTYGLFTMYLIMKKNTYPYVNHNCYLHGNNDVWYDKKRNMGRITNCMISMQAISDSDKYAEVVTVLTPMYIDELQHWENTTPERRGEEYEAFKEEKAKEVFAFIRQQGVELESYVQKVYTTTPLSYRDYTGTVDGAAYGVMKNYQHPQNSFISTRTRISNLFFTGQNLNVHGALGVTLTSMISCADFVGQEYLAKKIGNV